MSESAKRKPAQEISATIARHGWARAAGQGVLAEARDAFARAGFADATLLIRWPEIAGPQIARIALPQRWQDGPDGAVLTLNCEAGAAVLLQHQTRMLIERLNTYLGDGRIKRLKLVPGRLSPRRDPPGHPRPDVQASPEPLPLSDALTRLARLRASLGSGQRKRTD